MVYVIVDEYQAKDTIIMFNPLSLAIEWDNESLFFLDKKASKVSLQFELQFLLERWTLLK